MEPIIIDDLIPKVYQEELLYTLTQPSFAWAYRPEISYGGNGMAEEFALHDPKIKETRAFSHRLYFDYTKTSEYCDFVRPILYFLEGLSIEIKMLERIRAVLVPKDISMKDYYNVPHIDLRDREHKTLIYYVNDCDGGTILFNEKHNPNIELMNPSRKTVDRFVQAKKGRILIFDGLTFHTGVVPTDQDKILINFNFV